jgi:hypothetical protein
MNESPPVLFVVLGAVSFAQVSFIQRKRDSAGNPMFHPDGRPMMKDSYVEVIRHQPVPNIFFAIGVLFFVRAIVFGARPRRSRHEGPPRF